MPNAGVQLLLLLLLEELSPRLDQLLRRHGLEQRPSCRRIQIRLRIPSDRRAGPPLASGNQRDLYLRNGEGPKLKDPGEPHPTRPGDLAVRLLQAVGIQPRRLSPPLQLERRNNVRTPENRQPSE